MYDRIKDNNEIRKRIKNCVMSSWDDSVFVKVRMIIYTIDHPPLLWVRKKTNEHKSKFDQENDKSKKKKQHARGEYEDKLPI